MEFMLNNSSIPRIFTTSRYYSPGTRKHCFSLYRWWLLHTSRYVWVVAVCVIRTASRYEKRLMRSYVCIQAKMKRMRAYVYVCVRNTYYETIWKTNNALLCVHWSKNVYVCARVCVCNYIEDRFSYHPICSSGGGGYRANGLTLTGFG
jgi:hypothetical protein